MKIKKTNRGFSVIEFKDSYGKQCSLQESSSASEPKIWFGVDDVPNGLGGMHLTREQVKELLPHLNRFVKTGDLSE